MRLQFTCTPKIDVLVNNAGLALGLEPAFDANPDDWDVMINTNTKGLVNMTYEVLQAWLPTITVILLILALRRRAGLTKVAMFTVQPRLLLNSFHLVYVGFTGEKPSD